MKCPQCGHNTKHPQARVTVRLDFNEIVIDGDRRRVTPGQCELLYVLARAMPSPVAMDDIAAALWGQGHEPVGAFNVIRCQASKIRVRLADTPIKILNHWGAYSLVLKEAA